MTKYMTSASVLHALKMGHKLKRSSWIRPEIYIQRIGHHNIVFHDGTELEAGHYRDIFWLDEELSSYYEDWEETKPVINLTSDMVGRKVRLRGGQIRIIGGYTGDKVIEYPFYIGDGDWVRADGRYTLSEDHRDVVEVLP